MKYFIFFLASFLVVLCQAQTLEVEYNGQNKIQVGEIVETSVSITNTSENTVQLKLLRKGTQINRSQRITLCLGSDCYPQAKEEFAIPIFLEPGQTVDDLRIRFDAGISEGMSQVVFDVQANGSSVSEAKISMEYHVYEKLESDGLFKNKDIKIDDFYPNPVRDFVFIDYKVSNTKNDYRIMIHSVLGSVVSDNRLDPMNNQLKVRTKDLNPGVYFMTLYVDQVGIMTQKIIIQD